MKPWIGFALAGVLVGIIYFLNPEDQSAKDLSANVGAARVEAKKVAEIKGRKNPSPRSFSPKPAPGDKPSVPSEALEPEDAPLAALPKWQFHEPDSFLELRNVRAENKTDRPLVMVTFGSAPKANLKVEHREANVYSAPTSPSVLAAED